MNSVSHDAGSMAVVDQGESSASSNTSSLLFIPAPRQQELKEINGLEGLEGPGKPQASPSQAESSRPTFHGETRSDEVRRVGALRTNHLGGVVRERSVQAHVLAIVEQLRRPQSGPHATSCLAPTVFHTQFLP